VQTWKQTRSLIKARRLISRARLWRAEFGADMPRTWARSSWYRGEQTPLAHAGTLSSIFWRRRSSQQRNRMARHRAAGVGRRSRRALGDRHHMENGSKRECGAMWRQQAKRRNRRWGALIGGGGAWYAGGVLLLAGRAARWKEAFVLRPCSP